MADKGIVITSPMTETPNGVDFSGSLPDKQTLNKYFVYWDEVVVAEFVMVGGVRPIGIGNLGEFHDDDIRVAYQEGLLRKQPVDLGRTRVASGEIAPLHQEAQLKAATHLNQNQEGYWSLGQTVERLRLPEEETIRKRTFSTKLVEALPAPSEGVPTREILEFRDQHSHQLRKFQSKYHNLYSKVQHHPDQELALTNAVDELELALDELHTVMENQGLRPRRVSMDTFWEVSQAAGGAFLAATGAGLPTEYSLGIAGASALLSLEVNTESQPASWPDDIADYAYLFRVDQELSS